MKRFLIIIILAILTGIVILIFTSCAIPKEKHFYLEYGQTGYLHSPTIRRDEWMTIEIKAPTYKEIEVQEIVDDINNDEYIDQWDRWNLEK